MMEIYDILNKDVRLIHDDRLLENFRRGFTDRSKKRIAYKRKPKPKHPKEQTTLDCLERILNPSKNKKKKQKY